MLDLPLEFTDIRDEFVPQRDGKTVTQFKRVTFYLGKFGPFTERFPPDVTQADITLKIEALKRTLEALPK